MAAGLGFKTFTTGEVLTAADVNGYLMQGINVFASSAARAAAITSPQEGQYSFLKDTNALEYYDGAAWVGAPVGDITAVTAGTGISGGGSSGDVTVTNSMATAINAKADLIVGTADNAFDRLAVGTNGQVLTADSTVSPTGLKWATPATVSSGLVYVTGASFSAVSSFDLPTDTFTTAYRNYQIFIDFTSGSSAVQIRVRKAGTTYSSAIYEYGNVNINRGGTVVGVGGNGDTSWKMGYAGTNARGANIITVFNPKNSGQKITVTGSVGTGDGVNGQAGGMWQGTVSGIDSLNFSIATGTFDGAYRVYGLADA